MLVIVEEYKICKFCGRRFTKEDAIRIKGEQGYNHFDKLYWGKHRVFCGEWCSRLHAKYVVRKVLRMNINYRGWYKNEVKMLTYVKKYGNWKEKTVMLKDVCYI